MTFGVITADTLEQAAERAGTKMGNKGWDAAQAAITSPLLEDVSIDGAKGILINITSGYDLTMNELDEAASKVMERAHEDANIIVGSVLEADLEDEVRIMVIATGFDGSAAEQSVETQQVRTLGTRRKSQVTGDLLLYLSREDAKGARLLDLPAGDGIATQKLTHFPQFTNTASSGFLLPMK